VQSGHQTLLEVLESRHEEINDSFFSEQFLLQTDKL
jgi:hypothetical protein